MDENDPRRQLDPFTFELVEMLRTELEVTTKHLLNMHDKIALAQLDILRKGALKRLKSWDFEMQSDLSRAGASQFSEDDVLKLFRITIAAVEETFDSCREHVVDCANTINGTDDEPDAPE